MLKQNDMRVFMPAVFFLIASIFLFSCRKPEDALGVDVLPEEALINVQTLTIPVTSSTIAARPIPSDDAVVNLAGAVNDPVFGLTTAFFSSQFRLAVAWDTVAALQLDSIVLRIRPTLIYNDSINPVTLKVHELEQRIFRDSVYISNREVNISANPIGEKTFVPSLRDTNITIRLNDALGQRFINNAASSAFRVNEDFFRFFYGLQVRPDFNPAPGQGSIIHFGRTGSIIILYYKRAGEQTQRQFRLIVDNTTATINHSVFNYSGTSIPNAIGQQAGGGVNYLQGLGGVNARVRIPDMKDYIPAGVVLNKATLVIPIATGFNGFRPPTALDVRQVNQQGSVLRIIDEVMGDPHFGGRLNPNTNEYRMNITRFIQANVQTFPMNDLYLLPAFAELTPNRVVINSGTAAEKPMRLEVLYTNP
jgi:hypothetical protein